MTLAELAQAAQVSMPAIAPLLALSLGASLLLLLTALGAAGRRLAPGGALVVLAAAGSLTWSHRGRAAGSVYHGFIQDDAYALFATALFLVGATLVVLISTRYVACVESDHPEYYALVLFATAGMVVMSHSSDLLAFFIGLEMLSLSLYALTGMSRTGDAIEAAIKYFLMGAFASAFYLMGAALVFGAAGSTHYDQLAAGSASPLMPAGAALLLSAVAFKLAIPPFHMWAPDTYQGAPSTVTAFMAFGTKAAVFLALGRVVGTAGLPAGGGWRSVAVVLAVAAMVWGNSVALAQSHLRRLIAYSSISHAGTILLGVAAGVVGVPAVLFYLVAYTFAITGLFGSIVALRRRGHEVLLVKDLAGLSRRSPLLAGLIALFLLSLAGFPPTAGFLAKFLVFKAAVVQHLVLAAVLGALASVVGVFYYLWVVVTMFMREAEEGAEPESVLSPAIALALVVAFLGTLPLGLFPGRLLHAAELAVRALHS